MVVLDNLSDYSVLYNQIVSLQKGFLKTWLFSENNPPAVIFTAEARLSSLYPTCIGKRPCGHLPITRLIPAKKRYYFHKKIKEAEI